MLKVTREGCKISGGESASLCAFFAFRFDLDLQQTQLIVQLVYIFVHVHKFIDLSPHFQQVLRFLSQHKKVFVVLLLVILLGTCKDEDSVGLGVNFHGVHFVFVRTHSELLRKMLQYAYLLQDEFHDLKRYACIQIKLDFGVQR